MFVITNRKNQRLPVKVWLDNEEQLDPGCLQQALNAASLPFAHSHIAVMPDAHEGYGVHIGCVFAADGAIVPNAVGVDIGCGVAFVQTNIPVALLRQPTPGGSLAQSLVGAIMRSVPTGFSHHRQPQKCRTLDRLKNDPKVYQEYHVPELAGEIDRGYYQIGTLGGGNHFIELQEDEDGMTGIMIHTGSRNFGYKICGHFNRVAKALDSGGFAVPREWDLACLPVDSEAGQMYIRWMQLALDFARENRAAILARVKEILYDQVERYTGFRDIAETLELNCHHNYAGRETHFGKEVWVHRKGAIRARKGEPGIIPGAMGSFSYLVEGLGNPDSFHSCSHGAGRKMSRNQAMAQYTVAEVVSDLQQQGVVLGKQKKKDVPEEARFVYKDIDAVMAQQSDLVLPVKRLRTVAVVKG